MKSRASLKVLLVDDDPFQLEFIADVLRSLTIQDITQATSGEKALQAMSVTKGGAASAFDLMVIDLHMPGMDGFQFMEAASKAGFKGALIIASGQNTRVVNSATLVAQLRRFNLLGSLQKPVEKTAMSDLLAKLAL
jgi:CheY-like chemotaxis protein